MSPHSGISDLYVQCFSQQVEMCVIQQYSPFVLLLYQYVLHGLFQMVHCGIRPWLKTY